MGSGGRPSHPPEVCGRSGEEAPRRPLLLSLRADGADCHSAEGGGLVQDRRPRPARPVGQAARRPRFRGGADGGECECAQRRRREDPEDPQGDDEPDSAGPRNRAAPEEQRVLRGRRAVSLAPGAQESEDPGFLGGRVHAGRRRAVRRRHGSHGEVGGNACPRRHGLLSRLSQGRNDQHQGPRRPRVGRDQLRRVRMGDVRPDPAARQEAADSRAQTEAEPPAHRDPAARPARSAGRADPHQPKRRRPQEGRGRRGLPLARLHRGGTGRHAARRRPLRGGFGREGAADSQEADEGPSRREGRRSMGGCA